MGLGSVFSPHESAPLESADRGFRWRRRSAVDGGETAYHACSAKISELLASPLACAIGKIGTTELMGLEYLYGRIQLPWPAAASWRRPAQRLHDCSGLFTVRRDIFLRWAVELREALKKMGILAQWQAIKSRWARKA